VVAPGADPKLIRVKWEGSSQVTKNASGDLALSASLVVKKPVILQEGKRIEGGNLVDYSDVDNDPAGASQALQHDKRIVPTKPPIAPVKASLRDRG